MRPGPLPPGLVLAVALLSVSFGGLFARWAAMPALAVTAWRVTLATLIVWLARAVWHRFRPAPAAESYLTRDVLRARWQATACGLLLALHFATWITSLGYTTVAESTLLADSTPVWVLLVGWVVLGRRPQPRQWAALLLAAAGIVVLVGGEISAGISLGNLLAVASAVFMALYLLVAEAAQRVLRFGQFVAHSYAVAAVVAWGLVLATGTSAAWQVGRIPSSSWGALLGVAVVSQCIGHGGFNYSVRSVPPAVVSLTILGEPVIAGLLAWGLLGEVPAAAFYPGAALVLAGVGLAAWPAKSGKAA
jgi:drug/metabolite transporter (DMT)-like permease